MAADAPDSDVHVDAALVARLVQAQHPSFAGPVELVANGWDNAIFRLGERWVARMPRRAHSSMMRSSAHCLRTVAVLIESQWWSWEKSRMVGREKVRAGFRAAAGG